MELCLTLILGGDCSVPGGPPVETFGYFTDDALANPYYFDDAAADRYVVKDS